MELVNIAGGWRFHARPEMQKFLDRLNPKTAALFACCAGNACYYCYRQPVTRGDIEEIRGVAVSGPVLKALESRGWIGAIGHRDVPGRPALYATTMDFLNDLNLRSLEELPPLEELGSLLESNGSMELLPAPELAAATDHTEVMPLLQTSVDAEQDKVADDILAQQRNLVDE